MKALKNSSKDLKHQQPKNQLSTPGEIQTLNTNNSMENSRI
jgi:hypothetical protein